MAMCLSVAFPRRSKSKIDYDSGNFQDGLISINPFGELFFLQRRIYMPSSLLSHLCLLRKTCIGVPRI